MNLEIYQILLVALANLMVIGVAIGYFTTIFSQSGGKQASAALNSSTGEHPSEQQELDEVYSQLHDEATGCPTDALLIHRIHQLLGPVKQEADDLEDDTLSLIHI